MYNEQLKANLHKARRVVPRFVLLRSIAPQAALAGPASLPIQAAPCYESLP